MGGSVLTRLKLTILLMVFFPGIGNSLAQKIPKGKNNIYDYMNSPELTSFALLPTTPQEVINLANLAEYSHSPGPDGIDPLIARKTIESVAGMISDIINSSFETLQGLFHQILYLCYHTLQKLWRKLCVIGLLVILIK